MNGLLLAVRRSLLDACDPSVSEIIPGRLAHYRLALRGGVRMHVIHVYQYASQQKDKQENRHRLWQALQAHLHGIPKRDLLVVCGDF